MHNLTFTEHQIYFGNMYFNLDARKKGNKKLECMSSECLELMTTTNRWKDWMNNVIEKW